MPLWVEVIIGWVVIVAVINLAAMTVFRKRGYFKWLNNVHDSNAYRVGYEDAQKAMHNSAPTYNKDFYGFSENAQNHSIHPSQLREHGIKDNRYKIK